MFVSTRRSESTEYIAERRGEDMLHIERLLNKNSERSQGRWCRRLHRCRRKQTLGCALPADATETLNQAGSNPETV